jgi:hypothetical protein
MTVTRATTSRLLLRNGHSARGRGRVWESGAHAAGQGIGATAITAADACRHGSRVHRLSAFAASAPKTAAWLVTRSFELQ